MRTVLAILITIFLCSCEKVEKKNPILGNWQLVETTIGTGGEFVVSNFSNGDVVQFRSDYTILDENGHFGCDSYTNGSYKTTQEGNQQVVDIKLDCLKPDTLLSLKKQFTLLDGFLYLQQMPRCIEGCIYKYKSVE